MELHKKLINAISDKTCLFIYFPEKEYFERLIVFNQIKYNLHLGLSFRTLRIQVLIGKTIIYSNHDVSHSSLIRLYVIIGVETES